MHYHSRNTKYVLLSAATIFCMTLSAQRRINHHTPSTMARVKALGAEASARLDSLIRSMHAGLMPIKRSEALSNPYYFPIFAPAALYDATLSRTLTTNSDSTYKSDNTILISTVDQALIYAYTMRPELVRVIAGKGEGAEEIAAAETPEKVKAEVKLTEKAEKSAKTGVDDKKDNRQPPSTPQWNIDVRRPNFWKFKTDVSFHFTQNYISSNWYKGGESNNSLLASVNFEANYNNKQKVELYNKLETKIGFQTSRSDEKRKFKTNSDLLRLTNRLGFKASKHWYYTFMLQSWTQFYHGYRHNDDRVYSDFMSPFESLFSIGMDYRLNVKKFNLNATISPFACNFKYVDRGYLATSFGLKEGKHSRFTFGSNITMKWDWTICKNVRWDARLYYFTDYDKTQIEWENTFNLTINKYLKTKLFLYPRFDDSANRKDGCTYFQFNELLTIGLDVTF